MIDEFNFYIGDHEISAGITYCNYYDGGYEWEADYYLVYAGRERKIDLYKCKNKPSYSRLEELFNRALDSRLEERRCGI